MIVAVTYIQFAILLVEPNATRIFKLQGTAAMCANCSNKPPIGGKLLNTVVNMVHYVDIVIIVNSDNRGRVKLSLGWNTTSTMPLMIEPYPFLA